MSGPEKDLTRQLEIIHVSDLHFGELHRFREPATQRGDRPKDPHYPNLADKLIEDLATSDPGCPVILCATGDFAEKAKKEEFDEARDFLDKLANATILGKKRGRDSIFIVPGNHDVDFSTSDMAQKWFQWTRFYNSFFGTTYVSDDPWSFIRFHDLSASIGAIVLCLNSSLFITKGSEDEHRGRIGSKQLGMINTFLKTLDPNRIKNSIRIALIHHHPILIPALAEPDKNYDAVMESGLLLSELRRFGFHIILHGHKHNPHTFTEDATAAYQDTVVHPLFISCGGSVGSKSLPPGASLNCYNHIRIKWHPAGLQTRVYVRTRGLTVFNDDKSEKAPVLWNWMTLKEDDRQFFGCSRTPRPSQNADIREYDDSHDRKFDELRTNIYQETRGNLIVVETLPSLEPGQAYEARCWIVQHGKRLEDVPVEVTWAAGKMHTLTTVKRDHAPHFCATMTYWGPMLIQARLRFQDEYSACAYAYARMPERYPD